MATIERIPVIPIEEITIHLTVEEASKLKAIIGFPFDRDSEGAQAFITSLYFGLERIDI